MERSVLEEAIYNRYIVPTRRKRTHLAGLEFEMPIVNEKNEPVNFEVIYQVTDRFIDTFSFLNHVTPFTAANGYYQATGYSGGRVVPSTGGGICRFHPRCIMPF